MNASSSTLVEFAAFFWALVGIDGSRTGARAEIRPAVAAAWFSLDFNSAAAIASEPLLFGGGLVKVMFGVTWTLVSTSATEHLPRDERHRDKG